MNETIGVPVSAKLRIRGGPVPTKPAHLGAVWADDEILPVRRIGNRWLCKVWFGYEHDHRMEALIPKKWLRLDFVWVNRECL